MSKIILSEQSGTPSTPSSGKVAAYIDNTGVPLIKWVDDTGAVQTAVDDKLIRRAYSTGTVTPYSSATLVQGTAITFPSGRPPVAGCVYHARFDMVKDANGTATPIIAVQFGTNGTTADADILTFTFTAGSAAADTGIFEIWTHFRSVGSGTSAVLVGVCTVNHTLAATGLTTGGTGGMFQQAVVSSGFDSTVANSIISVTFNGGASFNGTCTLAEAELRNFSV